MGDILAHHPLFSVTCLVSVKREKLCSHNSTHYIVPRERGFIFIVARLTLLELLETLQRNSIPDGSFIHVGPLFLHCMVHHIVVLSL